MKTTSYNAIEIRYAEGELANQQFVVESDFTALEERLVIMMGERTYWHNMYNGEANEHCKD